MQVRCFISGCLLFFVMADAFPLGDPVAGAEKAELCLECHVMDGDNPDPMIPKLDGQQEQYIVRQVLDYKSGRRPSSVMREVTETLTDMEDLVDIAAFYSDRDVMTGSGEKTEQTERGQELYVEYNCHFCHGVDAKPGTEFIAGAPVIGGQNDDYLEKTMLDIKMGRRPADIYNLMKKVLLKLSDKEIAALAAYVSSL
jgi:cytochrome c553